MNETYEATRVLVTVKTYPHPSPSHYELVCTAGITEAKEWVRLYPIDFRYRPFKQQFEKYQWISVDLSTRTVRHDNRKESRRPNVDSIRLIGEPLSTKNGWEKRRAVIDAMPHHTLNELKSLYKQDKTSLGIVRPKRILDLRVKPDTDQWKPEWRALFEQYRLLGPQQKPLKKLPYKFSYIFECEDSVRPHSAMIEDWELGALFLREAEKSGSNERAAESVKKKFLNQICDPSRDTRFFMGTTWPHNSWVVVGIFWPPKQSASKLVDEWTQKSLF